MARRQDIVPNALRPWIEARQRFHLTDAQVQMARELGLNPKKLGKVANHRQEPWKAPLPAYIERLYVKRFGKSRPDVTGSIEEVAAARRVKKAARKEARDARREAAADVLLPEAISATHDDTDAVTPDGAAIDQPNWETQAMPKQATTVTWHDLSTSFEYVSSGQPYENVAVLNRESGEFLWRSELGGDLDDEWPDDVEDDEKYLGIPHKRELDLGKPLVMDFVREFLPDAVDDVHRIFGRQGAYAKFKDLLHRRNALEQWYAFENEATERVLREWCEENDVVIVSGDGATDDGDRRVGGRTNKPSS
jgi:hypothetical protein